MINLNVKSEHIFIYILPGAYLILNLIILLHLFNYIELGKILRNINLASSVLILLLSLIVGYINHISYYIVMGHNLSSVTLFLKIIEDRYEKKNKHLKEFLYNEISELNNIGALFVSASVIILILVLLILFKRQVSDNFFYTLIQLCVNLYVAIGTKRIIDKKIKEFKEIRSHFI